MKRGTPMKRVALRRTEGPTAPLERKPAAKAAKVRHCAWEPCGRAFLPLMPMQRVCGPVCARKVAVVKRKEDLARAKYELKARKEKLLRIPDLIALAQKEFNAYIRLRDRARPCICCGKPLGHGEVGGAYDCGHYRSTGSAAHLRFDERNAHAQRKYCNRHGAGRAVDYRIGLVARIGLAAVEALEADNTPHKWTREELIAIKETYRAKRREMEARSAT